MLARKPLEPVERAIFVEGGEIGFERKGRVEDAGAAAGRFLRADGMRRAVGAEEEFGRTRGCGGAHRQAMPLALGDRSEEHTSELQSLMRISYAVFCLKKKNKPPTDKNSKHEH